jgi:hypothetical protein
MAIVKQSAAEIKYQGQEHVKQLFAQAEQAVRRGEAAHEVERQIFRSVLQLGHQVLGFYLQLAGDGDQGESLTLDGGCLLKRLESPSTKIYQTVFGEFELERRVYAVREGQRHECIPLDAQLQLPESTVSYLLQDWSQALTVEMPHQQAQSVLERILEVKIAVSKLERVNVAMSTDVADYLEVTPAIPAPDGEFIVISGDGKGVPMRKAPGSARILTHDTKRGPKPDRKKMAIVGAVYDAQCYQRSAYQVWQALFDETPAAANEEDFQPRPKPIAKVVRAALTEVDDHGDEINARETIFHWLGEQVQQRDPLEHKEVVVLMDGQACLWDDARQALGTRSGVEILDLLHATSKLWDLIHVFHPSGSAEEMPAMKLFTRLLLQGGVHHIVTWFRHGASESELSASERRRVENICGYFENHRARMRYDEYLAAGYPIASGVIEGACRHVVKDRMERSGMHWTRTGAQAMLALRCVAINEQWPRFTQFHIQQENKRLYPYRAQLALPENPLPMAA